MAFLNEENRSKKRKEFEELFIFPRCPIVPHPFRMWCWQAIREKRKEDDSHEGQKITVFEEVTYRNEDTIHQWKR